MLNIGTQSTRSASHVHAMRAMPQFSLAHLTALAYSPPELTEIAARAGYDFVSFRTIPLGLPGERVYALDKDRALFNQTRTALRSSEMRVLDIELARIYEGVDVKNYVPAMEAGAQLGARHLLSSAWCSDRAFVLERFIELCELAEPFGLTVDFEFVTFTPYRNLRDAAELVRASRCANAGICIDTLHFDRSDCNIDELAELPPHWMHYAQICDGPANYAVDEPSMKRIAREARLYLGEGGIDVPGILSHLPAMPYSIELPNTARLRELGPTEFARRCRVTALKCLVGEPVHSIAA
ncbi:MAG: sugar phosphate isomerase/epimerase [Steroidobacteraceae bacterium]